MASTAEGIINDVIALRPPHEVVHPHGSNAFALQDGVDHHAHHAKQANVDIEALGKASPSDLGDEEYRTPTDDEFAVLRRVSGTIPGVAWWLCLIEFAERASYYGASGVFSNYMEFPLPPGGNGAGAPPAGSEETAGALGRGEEFSNAFTLLFMFLAYIIPIFGGWIADTKWGRLKTILIGVLICGVAHVIMICGAIPSLLQAGNGTAPFIISLLLLAIGAGIFKPNISPTLIDQYKHQQPYVETLRTGEKVIVDPESTVQRISLIFYALVNVGAFYSIATEYCERDVGYWLAYLTPGIVYFLLPLVLWYLRNRLVTYPPSGSALNKFAAIGWATIRHGGWKVWREDYWESAKPSLLASKGISSIGKKPIAWTDKDVVKFQRTISACMIFLYFPIYILCDGGIGNVSTNQAASMTTDGAPNDLIGNINPIAIIVTVPILSYIVYPMFRRYNIKFGRVSRILFGFNLAMISSVIGAIIQWRIYETSPCGYYASDCTIGDQVSPVSVWWQTPIFWLGGMSECFSNVTAYELAYARAPRDMRGIVISVFLASYALSSALGEILVPVTVDPYLIWIWAAPAIALFLQNIIFWIKFKKFNHDEFLPDDDEEEDEYELGPISTAHEDTAVAGDSKPGKIHLA